MDDTLSATGSSSIFQHEKNIAMLFDTLKELKMSTKDPNNANVYSKVENLLSKEMDTIHMSEFIGLECDSDDEIEEDDSEIEYFSDDESTRTVIDYDIEKMFEIVKRRDFNKWSISTIHGRYNKIHLNDAGRKQLSRMRSYIKRGTIKHRIDYERLRNDIWNEVYSLDKEGVILHDIDIQQIAMIKANEKKLYDFKASNGWLYYFKKQHKILECYSDKVPAMKSCHDEMKLKNSIKRFKSERMSAIMAHDPDKVWNVDQIGLQLEIHPDRKIKLRGRKKIIRPVQHIDTTIHSFIIHVQMKASGKLAPKLPVILYESVDSPQQSRDEIRNYPNLHVYHSGESGRKGNEIAKQWMDDVFLNIVENDSILIIDSWSGYNQMMEIPQIADKKLKIIQLPAGSGSVLQPIDVYFNRPFKDLIRRIFTKIRWQQNGYKLESRQNVLDVLDMIWFQCKAPKFVIFLKYSWFRAGYTHEHPSDFVTPAQFCLDFSGYMKCEAHSCTNVCFMRCAHCELHYCFNDILEHRHTIEP